VILPLARGTQTRAEFKVRTGRGTPNRRPFTVSTRLCRTLSRTRFEPAPAVSDRTVGSTSDFSDLELTVRPQSTSQTLPALRKIPQDVL